MNKKINDITFREFHRELLGIDCYKNGRLVPRFILFYKGYNVLNILRNKTDLALRERKKK